MSLWSRLLVGTLPVVPKFIVGKVAKRYVAGEGIEDALATVRALNAEGAMATVDIKANSGSTVPRSSRAISKMLIFFGMVHFLHRDLCWSPGARVNRDE